MLFIFEILLHYKSIFKVFNVYKCIRPLPKNSRLLLSLPNLLLDRSKYRYYNLGS